MDKEVKCECGGDMIISVYGSEIDIYYCPSCGFEKLVLKDDIYVNEQKELFTFERDDNE